MTKSDRAARAAEGFALVRRHPVAVTALVLFGLAASVTIAAQQPPEAAPVTAAAGSTAPAVAASGATPAAAGGTVTETAAASAPGAAPTAGPKATSTPVPEKAGIIASYRYGYEPAWGTMEVQAYLDKQPGILKSTTYAAGGQRISIASAVATQGLLYSVNPKVLLTIMEMQSGLVRKPNPTPNEIGWAMGYRQEKYWGIGPQINWTARELFRAAREDQSYISARGWGSYAVSRLLVQTVDSSTQGWTFDRASAAFVKTYQELFGEDPRTPAANLPAPVTGPFLRAPYGVANVVASSAFDHEYPLLSENGSMVAHRGKRDQTSYDGHDGWDYALSTGSQVLAGAAGRVIVAGWSDDGCASAAGAVIIDHDNGYRTLYWHLSSVEVDLGARVTAGSVLGRSGNTGCSLGAHLHFGVQYLGRSTDPSGWCPEGTVKNDPWDNHLAGSPSWWLWTDRANPCTLR